MSYLLAVVAALFLSFPQVAREANIISVIAEEEPPILEKIAWCESNGRHYDKNGDVLVGEINKYDIGKFQINVLYWRELAEELGHDLYDEKGNEAMALALYEKYGTDPWNSSKKCWQA